VDEEYYRVWRSFEEIIEVGRKREKRLKAERMVEAKRMADNIFEPLQKA
jgi:hypothetical protein